ncbi:MAG TPA: adenylyltransferase/cytidyltransferase family protein [Patescibacteria group bacterium]|nr:adenylyltransferase/cytidyltransferase family protein [Patescibacteria group bacterium]
MKKVMVFGAFDGLHPGHLDFFKQAKKYGDFLIVSVGTDKNVAEIKGKTPLFNQRERLALIASVELVDKSVLGAERDFYKEIQKYKPYIICLGYDQWATEADARVELDRVGLKKTKVIRLKPYKTSKAKSTIVKKNSVDW